MSFRKSDDARLYEIAFNRFGRLYALGKPVFCLFNVDVDFRGSFEGVHITDFIDIFARTSLSRIDYNYAVERVSLIFTAILVFS